MAKLPLSVQMYTVREQQAKDFAGTVKAIAGMGYEAVELAGYGNLGSARDVRKAVDDAGLKVSGAHVALARLESELEAALDDQAVLGNRLVICPWVPPERRGDVGSWEKIAASLDRAGEACAARGLDFAYHHHSFEFQPIGGRVPMDIVWGETDAGRVRAEIDVYWIKHAGLDPVAYIDKLGGRVVTLHMKDMGAGEERRYAEVGTGILDFRAIAEAGRRAGVRWYVVEQDECYGRDPLGCVRTSMENLKGMGLA